MSDSIEQAQAARKPSVVEQQEAALAESARRGSLGATPNPTRQDAEADSKSTVPTSSVGQQNAPGRAGSIGEAAMGALGYGGATVERPKEEQGLGEKIVNFLGA